MAMQLRTIHHPMVSPWDSPRDIPDLNGRVAVVIGVNSGIGQPTALELARRGRLPVGGADTRPVDGVDARILCAVGGADARPGAEDGVLRMRVPSTMAFIPSTH